MFFFTHLVDSHCQLHVVFHKAGVIFSVLLKITGELAAIVNDMSFMSCALCVVSLVLVHIRLLTVILFKYPCLIQTDHSLLELFVVLNVLYDLKDIIFEAPHLDYLNIKFAAALQILFLKTLMFHSQIIYNEV